MNFSRLREVELKRGRSLLENAGCTTPEVHEPDWGGAVPTAPSLCAVQVSTPVGMVGKDIGARTQEVLLLRMAVSRGEVVLRGH